ncbi:hypothetical protein Tco_0455743 [Tanacetum coccineum]
MLCGLYFWPLSLSFTSVPSCDLMTLTNMLILCIILKALFQSLRKSLSLNLELSRYGEGVVISCFCVQFSLIAYSLSYFDSFDIPSDLLSVLMTPLIFTDIPFDLIFAIMILLILV